MALKVSQGPVQQTQQDAIKSMLRCNKPVPGQRRQRSCLRFGRKTNCSRFLFPELFCFKPWCLLRLTRMDISLTPKVWMNSCVGWRTKDLNRGGLNIVGDALISLQKESPEKQQKLFNWIWFFAHTLGSPRRGTSVDSGLSLNMVFTCKAKALKSNKSYLVGAGLLDPIFPPTLGSGLIINMVFTCKAKARARSSHFLEKLNPTFFYAWSNFESPLWYKNYGKLPKMLWRASEATLPYSRLAVWFGLFPPLGWPINVRSARPTIILQSILNKCDYALNKRSFHGKQANLTKLGINNIWLFCN